MEMTQACILNPKSKSNKDNYKKYLFTSYVTNTSLPKTQPLNLNTNYPGEQLFSLYREQPYCNYASKRDYCRSRQKVALLICILRLSKWQDKM